MYFESQPKTPQEDLEFSKSTRSIHQTSSSALARMRLRINPKDPNKELQALNTALLSKVTEIQECLASRQYLASLYISNALHEQAAPILKMEWQRVKAGEPVYRAAKYAAFAVFVLLCTLMVYGYLFTRHVASS